MRGQRRVRVHVGHITAMRRRRIVPAVIMLIIVTREFRPQRRKRKRDADMNEVISYPNKSFFLAQILMILSLGEQTSQSEHLDQFEDFAESSSTRQREDRLWVGEQSWTVNGGWGSGGGLCIQAFGPGPVSSVY